MTDDTSRLLESTCDAPGRLSAEGIDPAPTHPVDLFGKWLNEARSAEAAYPDAAALSTIDRAGWPESRIVLIKDTAPTACPSSRTTKVRRPWLWPSARARSYASTGRHGAARSASGGPSLGCRNRHLTAASRVEIVPRRSGHGRPTSPASVPIQSFSPNAALRSPPVFTERRCHARRTGVVSGCPRIAGNSGRKA